MVVPEGGLSAGPVCQSLRSLSPGGAFTEVIKGEFVFIPTTAHRSRPVSGQRELCAALRVREHGGPCTLGARAIAVPSHSESLGLRWQGSRIFMPHGHNKLTNY